FTRENSNRGQRQAIAVEFVQALELTSDVVRTQTARYVMSDCFRADIDRVLAKITDVTLEGFLEVVQGVQRHCPSFPVHDLHRHESGIVVNQNADGITSKPVDQCACSGQSSQFPR